MNIIGFAGKKTSGKNTACNFILGLKMMEHGLCQSFKITSKGQLWVSDILGDIENQGIFDILANKVSVQDFAKSNVYPFIKIYSFADQLKKICIDILGLSYEQCYGSNDDKNTLTKLKWENMPGFVEYCSKNDVSPSGFMTAREVLQYVGTDVFRKMYSNVWVDATIRAINNDSPELALIADVRFINEVEGIKQAGGKTIYLTRDPNNKQDKHSSETELDNYTGFDYTIDNANMGVGEQNKETYKLLTSLNLVADIIE